MSAFGGKADIDQPPFTTAAITAWRETLDERDRRGLKHPLSNVPRWRQSLMPKAKAGSGTKAEAARSHFLACVKALPPDRAASFWRLAQVEARIRATLRN